MKHRLKAALSCLFFTGTLAYGQSASVDPPMLGSKMSPSGGTSTMVTNNLYDGSANIQVPFYNTSINGVPINISAQYNTKGIKVNQSASVIGLGWNLSNGFSISRNIRDRPDEKGWPAFKWPATGTFQEIRGYWYTQHSGFTEFPENVDDEMDQFTLSLNGQPVVFYFSKNGNLITVPKSNIKIERFINGVNVTGVALAELTGTKTSETLLDFVVTDESGNKYYFSRGSYHNEFLNKAAETQGPLPIMGYYQNYCEVTDEWKIDQIITYPGKQILFDYSWKSIQKNMDKMDYTIEDHEMDQQVIASSKTQKFNGAKFLLSKITLPNNVIVDFSYNSTYRCDEPGDVSLNTISIRSFYNKGVTPIIENSIGYKFNYAYFNSLTPGTELSFSSACSSMSSDNLRLKLNSIDKTAGSSTLRYYDFEYDMSHTLPAKFSASQDIFGYYNAKVPVASTAFDPPLVSTVPLHSFYGLLSGTQIGVNKEPDPNQSQAAILIKFKNGAGGSTELSYKGHTGFAAAPDFTVGGSSTTLGANYLDGLFLYQQIEKDGLKAENDIITNYDPGTGQIFIPGIAQYYIMRYEGSSVDRYVWMSGGLATGQSINGSNHGYSSMTIRRLKRNSSGGTDMISKTVTYFTNCKENLSNTNVLTNKLDLGSSAKQYSQEPFTEKQYYREWALGLPAITESYDNNNNLISKTVNYYEFQDQVLSTDEYQSVKYLTKEYWSTGNVKDRYSDQYNLYTGSIGLTKSIVYDYTATDNAPTTKEYTYDAYNNPKTIKTTSAFAPAMTNKIFYNYDWVAFPSSAGSAINQLNSDGVKIPVYSEIWKKVGSIDMLVKAESKGLAVDALNIVNKTSYALNTINGLSAADYGTFPGLFNMQQASIGAVIPKFTKIDECANFDNNGNARDIVTLNNKYSAKLYNGKLNQLIAVIQNARVSEVAYTSFEGEYKPKGTYDDDKGNWDFDYNNIKRASNEFVLPASGNLIYEMIPNSSRDIVSAGVLSPFAGKKYVISFWSKGGCPVVKNNGVPVTLNEVEASVSIGAWSQYSAEFVVNGPVVITGVGGSYLSGRLFIDEVRFHPANAAMVTTTYEPMFGVKSTCDENNKFVVNEYDEWGRLVLVRNHWGSIISKTKYVQQGND